jgi:hypothetical protein
VKVADAGGEAKGEELPVIDDLRIVILNCPYDTWEGAETRELFGAMAALKLRGYRDDYAYGVLPLDTTDFVGCHYLLCEDRLGVLQPIMGCRMTSLERCRVHRLPFPALTLAEMVDARRHAEAIRAIMERCERQDIGIVYDGSWTIDPQTRRDRRLLHEIFTAMFVMVHDAYAIRETIAGAVLRLKTARHLSSWGYQPLELDGALLPPVAVQPLLGELVTLMHLREFTASARSIADRYRVLWEQRLTIEASTAAPRAAIGSVGGS